MTQRNNGKSRQIDSHVEGTSALLTKTQREWLRTNPTFDPDSAPQRARRSKLRKRLVRAIYDFQILYEGIPERDYDTVFETLAEDPHGSQDALSAMIAFVYEATTESHRHLERGPHNFRDVLTLAIMRVEAGRSIGEQDPTEMAVDVDFEVEKREMHDLDLQRVLQKIERDEMQDLSSEEVYQFLLLYRRADDRSPEGLVREMNAQDGHE